MTRTEYKRLNDEAVKGYSDPHMRDETNPAFIFSLTPTELLSKIAKGEINCKELAKRVLESRYCNINGNYAGPNHAIK